MQGPDVTSFAAARSHGWIWLVGLVALVAVPYGAAFGSGELAGEDAVAVWISAAVMVPLVGFLVATLVSLPFMRYELGPDSLVLRCGPMLRYRIPYAGITDVRRRDLTPSMWSSMRLPGLALWGVPYADAGTIYMCATRMAKGVLVVSTEKRRYGLTPAEEDRFVAELTAHLRSGRR